MRILFLIPARGGSKGLPDKNIKKIAGKPLIYYSIDAAKFFLDDQVMICVSTDSEKIKKKVEDYGMKVPFIRPSEISTDEASSESVMLHALNFYRKNGKEFDLLILLQPTSPLRNSRHISEALRLYNQSLDMIVSVKQTKSNPYFNLFEENKNGYLKRSKKNNFTRRQDCPNIYELNGAIYIINVNSLLKKGFLKLDKVKKYIMSEIDSVDIDTQQDLENAEKFVLNNK